MKKILYLLMAWIAVTPLSAKIKQVGAPFTPNIYLAPLVGVDIGGAIPTTFGTIEEIGSNVAPKLSPSLGLKIGYDITPSWGVVTEVCYKQVGIKAGAKVKDQLFQIKDADGSSQDVWFTGIADMDMDFTFLEVPVYAKWSWNEGRDKVICGLYAAWVINAKFDNIAQKGYLSDVPSNPTADQINPLNEPLVQPFTSIMTNWDLGVLIGYERRIFHNLNIGLRVSMGTVDIFKKGQNALGYEMRQMRGSLVLSYDLFAFPIKSASKN
ncbi:MAG: outer membrane beta-barrel protein [Bacteroidales bacterium]